MRKNSVTYGSIFTFPCQGHLQISELFHQKEDKIKNSFVVAWVIISITSFGLISGGPGSTVLAFYGTILFWVAFSYFVFGKLVSPQKKIMSHQHPKSGSVSIAKVSQQVKV